MPGDINDVEIGEELFLVEYKEGEGKGEVRIAEIL